MKGSRQILTGVLFVAFALRALGVSGPEAASAPPLETILDRALQQAKKEGENDRTFKSNYAFSQTKVTEFLTAKGEVTKHEEKTKVHDPANQPAPNQKRASRPGDGSNGAS